MTLEIANALWIDTIATLQPAFAKVAREAFGAEARTVPLAASTVGAAAINAWADGSTHHRVTKVVDDRLPDSTRLAVTNAVYFLGKWLEKFDSTRTREGDFAVSSRGRIRVPMMARTGTYGYRRVPGYAVARLPYRTGRVAMYVILPDSGIGLDSLARALEHDGWPRTFTPPERREVHVVLPRVKSELTLDLKPRLAAMGLRTALDCHGGSADFRGLTQLHRDGRRDALCIGAAAQAIFLKVDESGTEAAAVTVVEMAAVDSAPPPPPDFIVDRPFLFLIRDESSGAELFAGRIVRP